MNVQIEVPQAVIEKAGQRKSRVAVDSASKEFRQVMIIGTLAMNAKFGHFHLKHNNGRGKSLSLSLRHENPHCDAKATIKAVDEGKIDVTVFGKCWCGVQNEEETKKKKQVYVRKWSHGVVGMLPHEEEAKVFCGFGSDDDDSSHEIVDTEVPEETSPELAKRTSETTTTWESFSFGFGNFTIESLSLEGLLRLLLSFWFRGPAVTTISKRTTEFFKK